MLILKTSKCWVWFKGSLNNSGFWKEGSTCTIDEKPGVLNKSPLIPDKALWKII